MRILISGYYGFGNIGDEAILAATVPVLRQRWPGAEICVLSANPQQTVEAYGIEAARRWCPRIIWQELRKADLLISGGGGLLQDTTSLLSPLYYLGVMRMARAAHTPYVIFGQGLGPLHRSLVRRATRKYLSRAAAITLRDSDSADLARRIGVTGNIQVTADPAALLRPSPASQIQGLLTAAGVNLTRPLVGITLRAWLQVGSVVAAVAPLLKQAREQWGAEVLLIPFQPTEDVALAWRLAAESGVPVTILERLSDPRDYVGIIARLRLLVSMRLHGLVFAAAQAVPAIGLAYDPKVFAFASQAEQPTFSLDELSADGLLAAGERAIGDAQATAAGRQRCAQRLQRAAMCNFEVLERVLGELRQLSNARSA